MAHEEFKVNHTIKEECIICFYDKPIEEYMCFSCGHKVCATCYPLMRNTCPLCRYKENEVIDIHIIVPSSTTVTIQENTYTKIVINLLCGLLVIMVIYAVIILPMQSVT